MQKFNLNKTTLDNYMMLFHGNYGVGKTHLLGQALKWHIIKAEALWAHAELAEDKVKPPKGGLFINVAGEDGYLTIGGFNLGDIGTTAFSWEELELIVKEAKDENLAIIAIDGLKQIGDMAIRHVCGDRLPSVGKGSDDWSRIHRLVDVFFKQLRFAAPVIVCASASDRSLDQISGQVSLTPDMPGRQATGIAGKFDFVFVLNSSVIGPNKVKRTLLTSPVNGTVIRSRLPYRLPTEIELPDGQEGWEVLMREMIKALTGAK